MTKFDDPLLQAAHDLGKSKGGEVGRMVVGKDTTVERAQLLIDGYMYSDEDVMDICPKPLSGEYADDDKPLTVINEISELAGAESLLGKANIEEAMDSANDVLDTFESGYAEGFWEEVLKQANSILETNNVD